MLAQEKLKGKVIWFAADKGFGFIEPESGPDIFVHYSKIVAEPGIFRTLETGDVVEFELFMAERGEGSSKPQAKNVKIVEEYPDANAL